MTDFWTDVGNYEPRTFRSVLGSFMTGVTVVSTRAPDGEARAFTANSFASVSLDPPLVLVCLSKTSRSFSVFEEADTFSINVLGEWQRDTSNAFASRDPMIKAGAVRALGDGEVPFVRDSLTVLICNRHSITDAGDHIILIGEVQKVHATDGQPLGFFRGTYVGIGPAVRELEQLDAQLVVGGVLDVGDKVMLYRKSPKAPWELPLGSVARGERLGSVLRVLFARFAIDINVTLLYSLFHEQNERSTTLIFSVEARTAVEPRLFADGSEIALFGANDKPWDLISGAMKKGLLKRYFREKASGFWGIYFDTTDGGRIATLNAKPQSWDEWAVSNSLALDSGS